MFGPRWGLRLLLALLLHSGVFFGGVFFGGSLQAEPTHPAGENQKTAVLQPKYEHGVVAADHPAASRAGVDMLRRGGNVVDAAVATAFALSVVRPASCGIGGGGFMVIWNAESRKAVAVDYRERAPKAATKNMFADPDHPKKIRAGQPSRKGHLAVAVPGTVAGLCYVLKEYGTLDLKTVLAPAIRLARRGVPADRFTREAQTIALAEFSRNKAYRKRWSTLYRQYLNNGVRWKQGEKVRSPQWRVLTMIAESGADGFYRGPVAEALVEASRRGGGLLTLEDLAATKPIVRRPLRGTFDGFEIVTMPPPSSGGVALLESLNIIAAYEEMHGDKQRHRFPRGSTPALHLLTEAMKHAFADRAELLGDPDFSRIPVKRLISRNYASRLASRIDINRTKPPEAYGRFVGVDDAGTSHFSVIDRHGNAVACTETINTIFGSYEVEPRFGIVLNNQMDDFSAVVGVQNAFGLIQSEANSVAADKKPLSSMVPTILLKEGRAVHVLGASGGPRIISTSLQVLMNLTRYGMSPREAVKQPRLHHQWMPDILLAEEPLFSRAQRVLQKRGHTVRLRNNMSAAQVASRHNGGLMGAADARKGGAEAGF